MGCILKVLPACLLGQCRETDVFHSFLKINISCGVTVINSSSHLVNPIQVLNTLLSLSMCRSWGS